ncbi:MAG: hypothetical protein Q9179_005157 [Wetmoreana sp. 5 TL-2023]
MSFYYNYTGPYRGTLRVNQANQAPPTNFEEPVNPWLVSPPDGKVQAPTPQAANNQFIYYPHYDIHSTPPAQQKPAEPANPWLTPAPESAKASAFLAPYYAGQPIPEPAKVWVGSTKAQVDAQNAALAQGVGAYQQMQLAPANPTASQQFYCRELDGTYTLRTVTDIETSCQPGSWQTAVSGYPYFVRTKPA